VKCNFLVSYVGLYLITLTLHLQKRPSFSTIQSYIPGKFLKVVLEKNGEDQ